MIRDHQKFKRSVAIITISDRAASGERADESGKILADYLSSKGYDVVSRVIVPDEVDQIVSALLQFTEKQKVALILTTGGTGVSPRDVTPEATRQVIEKEIPGIAETMRAANLKKTPHAMLSRSVAGIRGESLIINLPGSPKGALENLQAVLAAIPHALDKIQGDQRECAN